ncbi:hypothetical protein Tco_1255479 [Tanacetum coccineum]
MELSNEFLVELQKSAYHRWIDKDVVNHITNVLEMVDLIYIPGVDSHKLRMKVFHLSLADDARQCEEEMLDERDKWGIDPLEFMLRVNSSFDKHMKIDRRTKKVLFHAWMNGSWNKRRMDDNILSNNNTTTDSFFKPYLITCGKSDTEKENKQSQTKHKYSNTSKSIDEQPNKTMCKAEKFEAIQYSLGPNEEYIDIRRCEYDIWRETMIICPKSTKIFFKKRTTDER